MTHNKKKNKENNTTEEFISQEQVEETTSQVEPEKTEEVIPPEQPADDTVQREEEEEEEKEEKEEQQQQQQQQQQEEPSFTEETSLDEQPEDLGSEDPSLGYWEKIMHFEGTTKTGLITAIVLLIAVVFSWEWINHTWWLVLILAGVSLRNLHKQRIELDEEKPFEAKVANISFFVTLIILIIRDLVLTNRLDNLLG